MLESEPKRVEQIGPYALRRSDGLVASLIISFVMGSPVVRIFSWILLLGCIGLTVLGLQTGDTGLVAVGFWFFCVVFLLAPFFRSRKRSRKILLDVANEGVVVETNEVRTLYKWPTIGKSRIIANRLLVMISGTQALIIRRDATSKENFDELCEAVIRLAPPPAP